MATIRRGDEVFEVADGAPILEACEMLGVPFGCQAGECATCVVEVAEGVENLAPPSQQEQWMALPPHLRLACQARLLQGEVVLDIG